MRLNNHLNENTTMKLQNTPYDKARVIRGYKGYDKLYVIKKGKMGYYISTNYPAKSLDDMIEVEGEYWFGTLKEIKKALGI